MTDAVRNASLALLALAASALAITKSCVEAPAPGPSPSPLPSVVASATPSPSPAPGPSPSAVPSPAPSGMRLMVGMSDGVEFVATQSGGAVTAVETPVLKAEVFSIRDVVTQIPSYKNARVGAYGAAIVPATQIVAGQKYWLEVTGKGAGSGTVGVGGVSLTVNVSPQTFAWPLPVYMEMQFAQIARAHGLADIGETFAQRVALAKKYAGLLRVHGVEPIKHAATVYPDTTFSDRNFRELVLDGRLHAPCLFGPAPNLPPSPALLQAIEAALKSGALPKDAWVYSWDEGEGDAAITQQALARVNLIRQYAPSLRQMITRRPDPAFGNVVFTPVMNLFNGWGSGTPGWLYVSCMSNGNCQNHATAATVAPATQYPMFVLDGPETDPARFVTEAAALGATGLLYFNTTQRMPTAYDPGGQYNEGGNGDGTLLYANNGVDKRLKMLRRGLNQLAWKKAGM